MEPSPETKGAHYIALLIGAQKAIFTASCSAIPAWAASSTSHAALWHVEAGHGGPARILIVQDP